MPPLIGLTTLYRYLCLLLQPSEWFPSFAPSLAFNCGLASVKPYLHRSGGICATSDGIRTTRGSRPLVFRFASIVAQVNMAN